MRVQLVFSLFFALQAAAIRPGNSLGSQYKRDLAAEDATGSRLVKRAAGVDPATLYPRHSLPVPVDFFPRKARYEPHSQAKFELSYWFDATYYKPGGPVFLLLGGETNGDGRLPFLQKGIVAQVIKATGGLGVILEHRYYGTSFPVPNLSVENMRFLSTEQALAEVAYFAKNVRFHGVDADLRSPKTPWIVYGGSYAGAQAAFLRTEYPDIFWGAISSSGVTKAIYDYWEYFEPIRQFGPPDCIKATQITIDVVDKILLKPNNAKNALALKTAFGLGNITDNRDFANVLTGVYGWQSTNWDPAINSDSFFNYCKAMGTTLINSTQEALRPTVKGLLAAAEYKSDTGVENIILNSIRYYSSVVTSWKASGQTQDNYFTTLNATVYKADSISQQEWRCWDYQVCTEWGYIQTGNTPKSIMPIVSRLLDVEYLTFFCRAAFGIDHPPDVEQVNKYGAFDIEYPRLAIIGGNADPWKPATPLADAARKRKSSTEKPVLEIAHAVHHWEENGVFPNETTALLPPNQVVYAQQFLKEFVVEWLKEWKGKH
ncbi:peptidase S28 [Amniculicola lignicola CBS 123094]|uniref:Peptidase S28 n=1 Tax=Amniculicola lignicola CBS 123094 TaxID=1392246 RepID=A0A6A5WKY6_9PLEO|nr:peptidase S28 [Amniculicola lignicola CBS 123094]